MNDRNLFHFSTEVRVRLPETDAFGIVFHGYYFTYFDVARMDYLRNVDALRFISPEAGCRNVLVHASADFRSPARFDDVLVIHARVSEFGRSSFTFHFLAAQKKENRVVAEGKTVLVTIDPKEWKSVPVPEEFRALIRKFEGPGLTDRKP